MRIGIGVADDDPRRIGALVLEDAQLLETDGESTLCVVMAEPRAASCPGRGAMDALLQRRYPGLVGPDLADDPRSDARIADAVGRLADELVRQVVDRSSVDQRLGRVVRPSIPAAAHHDVEAGGAGDTGEPGRIAADTRHRQIDQAPATGLAERRELLEDERLVAGQLPVVPPRRDVPQRDLGVLVREREPEIARIDRTEDRLDVRHGRPMLRRGDGRSLDTSDGKQDVEDGVRPPHRLLRSIGIAGLDALEQQPIEQRHEARGAKPSTSSQSGSSPRAMPSRSNSWAAPSSRSRRRASISRTPGSSPASAHARTRLTWPGLRRRTSSIVST